MRFLSTLPAVLVSVCLIAPPGRAQEEARPTEAAVQKVAAPFVVERGEDLLELLVPRSETLRYGAHLELGPVRARVGSVSLRAGVEEQRRSLLRPRGGDPGEVAWIEARAVGEYTVYTLDSLLETRFFPKAWPAMVHRMEQQGTERRRRELMVGTKNESHLLAYRGDTSHGAPAGTRIWGQTTELSCPEGSLDSVGAVYLVRSMISEGVESVTFPMLDKHRLWEVEIQLGEIQQIEVSAGRFNVRPVTLATERLQPTDHPAEEEKESFSGPFGIRGNIQLFVDERTGVPVLIAGTLPAGPLDIELEIRLESYEGTPAEFAPLSADEEPNG